MKTMTEFLSADWTNVLGWTLFHSIWQGLLILLVVAALMRMVPMRFSRSRYSVAVGSMLAFLAMVLSTFIYLNNDSFSPVINERGVRVPESAVGPLTPATALESVVPLARSAINENMQLILTCWLVGFMFSVLRLTRSLYFTYRLRLTARTLENQWSDYIREMSASLGIGRAVRLAESASIVTPIVIGYLKPIIVVPLGMLTGLSTEQLETIFIHELAHVKRHDYLINLLQSVVETVFFFNPFVLMISGLIRREREYCCDDLVVRKHGGTKAYAHALTMLAGVRLDTPAFGLPLAGNKNYLLNRIRRIMEKSVKNYSANGRMVLPVILVIAGMLCVSWLGINPDHGSKDVYSLDARDTLPAVPPVLDIPATPDVPDVPPVPDIEGILDTIPPPAFPFSDAGQWEEFSKSIDDHLRRALEKISALQDGEDFREMEEFKEKFESGDWQERFFGDSTSFRNLDQQLKRLQELEFKGLQERLERFQEYDLKNLEQQLQQLQEPLLEMEKKLRDRETSLREFERELHTELVKDGYLTKEEVIETMEWDDDTFKVNGKEINDADRAKYRELREKLK